MKKKIFKNVLLPLISVAVVIFILFVLSASINNELILPSPKVIFMEFIGLFKSSVFYAEVGSDLSRVISSFTIAFSAALVFGVTAGMNEIAEKLLLPLTAAMRAAPTMAIILWCLMIFKTDKSPSAVSFVVTFPMLYAAVVGAVKGRDKKLAEMAAVYNVGKFRVLTKLVIPDVARKLFPQFSSILAFNVKLIVAGEALAYTKLSLGREMAISNANLESAKLLAITFAVILLSVALQGLLNLIAYILRCSINGYRNKRIDEKIR